MQVVMQAAALRLAEEHPGELLELGRTQRLETAGQLMAPVEQAVDVLFDETLTLAHRHRVAEQEQHPRLGLDRPVGHAMQQPFEQLDRRCLVTMNTGRQQQVQAAILAVGWAHFERPLP